MVYIPNEWIWIVVLGFVIGFFLSLGVGANDVANTFGTSVGSKVLTLRNACILASIFETLGAVLLGAKVSDTVRKGILDVDAYTNETELFMVGNLAALGGSGVWLVIATILKLPVSATHSIIGAILGFTLVAKGANGVSWATLGGIVASWFVSPVLSGVVSTGIFLFCKYLILNKKDPLEPGLRLLPVFYACTVVINVFSIFYDGPELLHFDRIPLWATFLLSFGSGTLVGIGVYVIVVPWQRRKILEQVDAVYEMENKAKGDGPDPLPNELSYIKSIDGDLPNAVSQNGDLSQGWMHANLNPVFEGDDGKGNDEMYCEKYDSDHSEIRRSYKLSTSNSASGDAEDDGIPTSPSRMKPGLVNRIRRFSRSRANAEDSVTLTDNEDIDRYMGQLDDAPESQYSPPTESPDSLPSKESPMKTVDGASSSGSEPDPNLPKDETKDADTESGVTEQPEEVKDHPQTARLFSFLQILTAIFGAFAHGGNDVSNAIGPVVSIWLVATTGDIAAAAATPIWILFLGGAGISVGLWIWGRRVIETMGQDLSTVTPSSGFAIELGAAMTVLIASNLGVPISSTHCKVGSIVFVGRVRSKSNVDWKLFRNIILAWITTLPATGLVSAALMALLQLAV